MGGPDEIQSAGLKMDLERSEKKSLKEYKIASWVNEDIAPVNQEVQNRILKVSKTISDAGGKVDFEARPDVDLLEAMNTYQSLLLPTMSSRAGDDEYNLLKERVEKRDPTDNSESANTLRKQISSLRDYNRANNDRTHLRWKWHEFFKEYDAIITPVMATEAFDHNHANYGERTIMVDNDERPYFEQVFWAGIAICSYLPSTVIPTGLTEEGLPIGIQKIGPEYSDLKTIGLAKLLEEEGYRFTPPPNFPD